MRRILLAVAVVITVLVVEAPHAGAQEAELAANFVLRANSARRAHGVPDLIDQRAVTATSCDWNRVILGRRSLDHDPELRQHLDEVLGELTAWAENLGVGVSVDAIHSEWMSSPVHAAHVLDPDLRMVGVCVSFDSDRRLWVTQRFASTKPEARYAGPVIRPGGPAPPTSPPTSPSPTPAPPPTAPSPTAPPPPPTEPVAADTTSTTSAPPTTSAALPRPSGAQALAVPVRSSRRTGAPVFVALGLTALVLAVGGAEMIRRSRKARARS